MSQSPVNCGQLRGAACRLVDTFRWLALGCLLCVPLILLFKKAKARGSVAAH
jgi:hypothetical protein